jgi:hypothetical protein
VKRRRWTIFALTAAASHHGLELSAGIGLPGEPFLGRPRARGTWAALFAAVLTAASFGGRCCDPALAAWNGGLQALALQHYLLWPWRTFAGIPILTTADRLPQRWLPVYNAVLLAMLLSSSIGSLTECPAAGKRWHLLGLATLPVQYASARHHTAWLDRQSCGGHPQ